MTNPPQVQKQKLKHVFNPLRLKRGVVLVKNLPKGFYEDQLRQYFSQYGRVTRLRVARSQRTGQSKHFAYIEFMYPDVAKVASESMNNYVMFRHMLKTVYIPPEKQDHDYFKQNVKIIKRKDGTTKLITPVTKHIAKTVAKINAPVSNKRHANQVERSKYK